MACPWSDERLNVPLFFAWQSHGVRFVAAKSVRSSDNEAMAMSQMSDRERKPWGAVHDAVRSLLVEDRVNRSDAGGKNGPR
jgi:hypothetical protein